MQGPVDHQPAIPMKMPTKFVISQESAATGVTVTGSILDCVLTSYEMAMESKDVIMDHSALGEFIPTFAKIPGVTALVETFLIAHSVTSTELWVGTEFHRKLVKHATRIQGNLKTEDGNRTQEVTLNLPEIDRHMPIWFGLAHTAEMNLIKSSFCGEL